MDLICLSPVCAGWDRGMCEDVLCENAWEDAHSLYTSLHTHNDSCDLHTHTTQEGVRELDRRLASVIALAFDDCPTVRRVHVERERHALPEYA